MKSQPHRRAHLDGSSTSRCLPHLLFLELHTALLLKISHQFCTSFATLTVFVWPSWSFLTDESKVCIWVMGMMERQLRWCQQRWTKITFPTALLCPKGGLRTWMLTAAHVHILSSHLSRNMDVHILSSHLSHNMGNYFSPSLYQLRQKCKHGHVNGIEVFGDRMSSIAFCPRFCFPFHPIQGYSSFLTLSLSFGVILALSLSLSLSLFFIYIFVLFCYAHDRLVSRFTGVHFNMVCMNVHVLNMP